MPDCVLGVVQACTLLPAATRVWKCIWRWGAPVEQHREHCASTIWTRNACVWMVVPFHDVCSGFNVATATTNGRWPRTKATTIWLGLERLYEWVINILHHSYQIWLIHGASPQGYSNRGACENGAFDEENPEGIYWGCNRSRHLVAIREDASPKLRQNSEHSAWRCKRARGNMRCDQALGWRWRVGDHCTTWRLHCMNLKNL